ncbi:HAD family hydrolase [Streptomyces sp. PgraA7]|uniref:HAD family hydrolase n=1 Tax=unclassified Streptomyces TaxID=2593676 RepID=UPI000B50C554|nr:HAD family hydrolase [Streptomyces sp. SID8378]
MPDVHRAIGLGSGDLIERLLGPARDRGQDEAISSAHTVLYATHFERLPAFQGAAALLRSLEGRGWRVVLASRQADRSSPRCGRQAVGADEDICATARPDDVDQGKPSPEPVEFACHLAGVTPQRAVFVGAAQRTHSTLCAGARGYPMGGRRSKDTWK